MRNNILTRFVAIGALLCAISTGQATAAPDDSSSVVKVTAKAGDVDDQGNQSVTVTIQINDKWHIYANPVGSESLAAAQTKVTFKNKLEKTQVSYPPGKVVKDEFVEEGQYRTYEGKVTIKAKVRRVAGSKEPLQLVIQLQACNESSCLFPAKIPVTVK